MAVKNFSDLNVDQVRQYIEKKKESDFALIDVRQPMEYEEAHIPGGLLFPLPNLDSAIDSLPQGKELIIYCRSGNRSRVAAEFLIQTGKFDHPLYNMAGGITAWEGGLAFDFPKFQVFDLKAGKSELLKTAIDLEKGAAIFYGEAVKQAGEDPVGEVFSRLAKDEYAHAKALFKVLADSEKKIESFEDFYASLPGEQVEGGESLKDMVARLKEIQGGFCLNALELALDLEYTAFDLYRNLAEMESDSAAGKMLMDLSQAEKNHMRRIISALNQC